MEKDTVEKPIFVIGKTLKDYMQKKLIIYILALKLCTPDARLVKKKLNGYNVRSNQKCYKKQPNKLRS